MAKDVTKWLEQLGLGQYAAQFLEHDLEWELLPDLDQETLKDIGIVSAGHRLRMLKAAEKLRAGEQGTEPEDVPVSAKVPAPRGEAERRQLTVMFSDLVGSTALSQQLEAEDFRLVNRAYQDVCTTAIERYDGYVARYMGDGVLAYFGYPQAHEDDAERAVHAGLHIIELVSELAPLGNDILQDRLRTRVGIATGPVVVGDFVGAGPSRESAAFGDTPNLAARLQALAEPGYVLLSATTRQLVERFFRMEAVGPRKLKGFNGPVAVYRVVGPLGVQSASAALGGSLLTPLVGRQTEVSLIVGRSHQASEGAGQVVFLSADPGVGKSRLAYEAGRQLEEQFQLVRLYCSPYQTDTPLHPVIETLRRELGVSSRETVSERLGRIQRWIDELELDQEATIPILASLLTIPVTDHYKELSLAPEGLRERQLRVLLHLIQSLSRKKPLLVLAEDLHWADPTTLVFVERLVELIREERVLLIATGRPEYEPAWERQPNATSLVLNHLSSRESASMIAELLSGTARVSEETFQEIVERSDGVPLFVEELSRTVAELSTDSSAGTQVPQTLRDALTARLDRLPSEAREVAQIAAVIGRQFPIEWLESAAGRSAVAEALAELLRAGLVLERHTPSGMSYEFKHALVRDSAYESLLRDDRMTFHQRIAEVIEGSDGEQHPALLAFHYQSGGMPERALPYWIRAGEIAQHTDANEEAARHFDNALDYLAQLGEETVRTLGVVVDRSLTLHLSGRHEEARALLERYVSLAATLCAPELQAKYHITFGKVESFLGRRDAAMKQLEQAIGLAQSINDVSMLADGELAIAVEEIFKGHFKRPLERVKRVCALLEGKNQGLNELMLAYQLLAVTQAMTGHLAAGLRAANRAGDLAQSLGHYYMHPAETLSWVYRLSGRWSESIETLEAALRENPEPFREAILQYYLSVTYLESGQVATAVPMLFQSLEMARKYRSKQVQVWVLSSLAEALMKSGKLDQAEEIASEAMAMVTEIRAAKTQADRMAGLIACERGQFSRAMDLLENVEKHMAKEGLGMDHAKILSELASTARREGNLTLAADFLRRAYCRYRAIGLDSFADEVASQATQYGIELAAT